MSKGKVLGLIVVFLLVGGIVFGISRIAQNPEKYNKSESTSDVIVDAPRFSKISSENLIEIMGNPESQEDWTNKTSQGDLNVSTYSYTKNKIHYEFIVADNSVVRLTVYSNKSWTNEGDYFKYEKKNKEDTLELFGIKTNDNARKSVDNNITFRVNPVSDNVSDFNVQDININDKTFGFVKITYNSYYFD